MFELLNVKWGKAEFGTPSETITWSSEIEAEKLPIADGYDLDDIVTSLQNAFDRWEDVAAVDFERVDSGGNVVVGTNSLDDNVVAEAGYFPNPVPSEMYTMTSAVINFADELSEATRFSDWVPDEWDGDFNFFAVALHEIGHVLGLAHPSPPDDSQIMNFEISRDLTDLSDIDIGGAQFIYGLDGDDVPVDYEQPDLDFGAGDVESSDDEGGSGGGPFILLLGLLGLITAFFTGGVASPLVAMAAARVPQQDNDPNPDQPRADDHAGHDHSVGEDGMVYHGVSVSELLPAVDFTEIPNPCGCTGMCEHMVDPDEPVEDYLL